MKLNEQRKHERYPLVHQPDGVLFMKSAGVRFVVRQIRDISDAGISFTVDHAPTPGVQVAMEYSHRAADVEVYGRLAWCTPLVTEINAQTDEQRYVVGVELLSPTLLYTMLQRTPVHANE